MSKIFDRDLLEEKLGRFSEKHRVVFAVSCAQRNFPNYRIFSEEVSWGNYNVLLKALEYLWERLEEDEKFSPSILEEYIRQDEEITPDLEDFSTDKATYALDCCRALDHALKTALTGNPIEAAYASQASYETVDCFIQVTEALEYVDPLFEKKIAEHPLMVRELALQHEGLDLLRRTQPLTTALIMQLRHTSENEGRSNIGFKG